ncbi:hypothetical protein H0H93_007384, partial [Arthromyces matolae]
NQKVDLDNMGPRREGIDSNNIVNGARSRRPAAKVTDNDNVPSANAKPRETAPHRKPHVEEVDDEDNSDTSRAPRANPKNPKRVRETSNGGDTSDDSIEILEAFPPKKKVKKDASKDGSGQDETAEEELGEYQLLSMKINYLLGLARLIKNWDSPIYGFFNPIPTIE